MFAQWCVAVPSAPIYTQRMLRTFPSSTPHTMVPLTISCRMLSLTGFKGIQQIAQTSLVYTQRSLLHQNRLQPRVKTVIVRAAVPSVSAPLGFGQLGLGNEIVQALEVQGIQQPTEVQVCGRILMVKLANRWEAFSHPHPQHRPLLYHVCCKRQTH